MRLPGRARYHKEREGNPKVAATRDAKDSFMAMLVSPLQKKKLHSARCVGQKSGSLLPFGPPSPSLSISDSRSIGNVRLPLRQRL